MFRALQVISEQYLRRPIGNKAGFDTEGLFVTRVWCHMCLISELLEWLSLGFPSSSRNPHVAYPTFFCKDPPQSQSTQSHQFLFFVCTLHSTGFQFPGDRAKRCLLVQKPMAVMASTEDDKDGGPDGRDRERFLLRMLPTLNRPQQAHL